MQARSFFGSYCKLYISFVDFKKALDSISHDKLWGTMMYMGYPIHLIDLLAKLLQETAR